MSDVELVLCVENSKLPEGLRSDAEDKEVYVRLDGQRLTDRVAFRSLFCQKKSGGFDHEVVIIENWVKRPYAETSPLHRQIIPYVVLMSPCGKVITYERGGSGEEDRLHAKKSMGFGGHINWKDKLESINKHMNVISVAMWRELDEEIDFTEVMDRFDIPMAVDVDGVVVDNSTDVGKVHIGVVFIAWVAEDVLHHFVAKEQGVIQGIKVEELKHATLPQNLALFEEWSQIFALDFDMREE